MVAGRIGTEMREYHEQYFWADLRRLQTTAVPSDHVVAEYRGVQFFDSLDGALVPQVRRLRFAACFYFETLIDQGLHHHFRKHHGRFQSVRPLPKFGWFGMGPQILSPAKFVETARAQWSLPGDALSKELGEGAEYFPRWAHRFFVDERVEVPDGEPFRALGDQDLGDLGAVRWPA